MAEPAPGEPTAAEGPKVEGPKVTVVAPPTDKQKEPTAAPVPSVTSATSSKSKLGISCVVLDTDMTEELQKEIFEVAKEAWDKFPIKNFVYKPDEEDAIAPELGASFEVSTETAKEQNSNHLAHMAQYIKTEIDKRYRPCWHVIVGNQFGCYMTHDTGTFIYFDMGEYRPHVLMFKSGTLDQPLY